MNDVFIETKFGNIFIRLMPDVAPRHVAQFQNLASQGFYDGSLFHKVVPGFFIQGGDPNSKLNDRQLHGTGDAGEFLPLEISHLSHRRGMVSMARFQDPDSASCQFFIVLDDSPHLDGKYSIFGEVSAGMNAVDAISAEETDFRGNPLEPVPMSIKLQGD